MLLREIFTICALGLLLTGCSQPKIVRPIAFPAEASQSADEVIILPSEDQDYLSDVLERIGGYGAVSAPNVQIVVLKREGVEVISSAGGLISISSGTFRQIDSEGEFAFILAHELAHHILNHTSSDKAEARLEYEADQLGGKIFFHAGYAPAASFNALIDCYQGIHYFEKDRQAWTHPEAHQRIIALNNMYRSMGSWKSGITESAAFNRFRADILAHAG